MTLSFSDIVRHHSEIVTALDYGEQIQLTQEAEAHLGKCDLYYLTKYILGYKDLGRFHQSLGRFFDENKNENVGVLAPRGHYKTTMYTVAGKIQLVLNDPNITILLLSNTVDNAESFLREIRAHFCNNEKLRDLYPEHAPHTKREEGTNSKWTTPARTNPTIRMATIETAGIDRALVSRHFIHAHYDDIVDDKNIATPELREKNWAAYNTSLSLIDGVASNGYPWHHWIGTRWHMDDTWSRLIDLQRKDKPFKMRIWPAYWKETTKAGSATRFLFPEQFSEAKLDYLRKSQGDARFSCLYLNNPVPDASAVLSPDYFRFYSPADLKGKPLNTVITVDPSPSQDQRKGDPTVITVGSMDADKNIYIREVVRCWEDPDWVTTKILDLAVAYDVRQVGIESVCFSSWLCFWVERQKQERHVYFEVVPMKRDSKMSKSKRQERIIPYHRNGKIHYRQDEPEMEIITREHREYGYGRFDDYLDTLTDMIELLKPAFVRKAEPKFRHPPRAQAGRNNFHTGYSTY